ncbi:hypothetical protein C4579_04170 [Candidatus Microgenomates bacterium]|nr:MAG: hypothetical protein C4579_04170 [Candidatus Microgenomates bacterium]
MAKEAFHPTFQGSEIQKGSVFPVDLKGEEKRPKRRGQFHPLSRRRISPLPNMQEEPIVQVITPDVQNQEPGQVDIIYIPRKPTLVTFPYGALTVRKSS